MLRKACNRVLCCAAPPTMVPRARWQNSVWSEALAQLEKECETCCPMPRFSEQKVTVVGAASDVGRIACLFLKQQPVIKILAMYDDGPTKGLLGYATDIAHIDTTTAVEAYQGKRYLRHALHNADVVLICGGEFPKPYRCDMQDRELFFENMTLVRSTSLACSRFCPHAVIAIQTPPIDCNFTLAKHTLKEAGAYDKRRLLGINAVNSMRANQLYAAIVNNDPAGSTVPVLGGTSRCTRVPVFSAAKSFFCIPPEKLGCLTRLVREADEIICKVKLNNEQGHLSIGFSSARFVAGLMKGLFEKPAFIDSALVEQNEPSKCFNMKYCSTPLTFGKDGIEAYQIPRLTEFESDLLENSKCDLEDMLNLGRCYATGDQYYLHPCKCPPCPPCPIYPPCPMCYRCDLEDMLNLGRCYATGDQYYLHPCKCPPSPCPPCPPCPLYPPCPVCTECAAEVKD